MQNDKLIEQILHAISEHLNFSLNKLDFQCFGSSHLRKHISDNAPSCNIDQGIIVTIKR